MEIRAVKKDIKLFQKYKLPEGWTLTEDNAIKESVIMILVNGKLVPWASGREQIESFLKYGYVRVKKSCPYQFGKCKMEKCALYIIDNNRGECVKVWNYYKK